MWKTLPIGIGLVVVIFCGIVLGMWTDRWGQSEEPAASAARLENMPMDIGDWIGRKVELDDRQRQAADVAGYVMRHYVNRRTGAGKKAELSCLVVCGRPAPIARHSPDVCYWAIGYDVVGQQVMHSEKPQRLPETAELWVINLAKRNDPSPKYMRVFWTYSATGDWQAPDNPRISFARYPKLFKLYVIRDIDSPDEPIKEDPALDFIRRALPEMEKAFFPERMLPLSQRDDSCSPWGNEGQEVRPSSLFHDGKVAFVPSSLSATPRVAAKHLTAPRNGELYATC